MRPGLEWKWIYDAHNQDAEPLAAGFDKLEELRAHLKKAHPLADIYCEWED